VIPVSLNNRLRLPQSSWLALLGALCFTTPAAAERLTIDTDHSTLTVHVFKSGLFKSFADNHEIAAPIKAGVVDDGPTASVRISVDATAMRVKDPGLSPHDREEVQTRMLGSEVLDASQFREIRFESTSVERSGPAGWIVQGQLSLHGQTRPVTVKVALSEGHYKGSASFKQTSFGIKPVTVAGGTVKVKDEVTIDFDIVARSSSGTPQVRGPSDPSTRP
jgi:polyisoprenoid-binding protein YceI